MHSLKEHISPKFEAGFPFSRIYTKKIVIISPLKIFLLLRIALVKSSFLSKVHNSFILRKVTLSVNQSLGNQQLTTCFDIDEKILM